MSANLKHNGHLYQVNPDGTAYQVGPDGEVVRDFAYRRVGDGTWVMGSFRLFVPPETSRALEQAWKELQKA